MGEAKVIQDRVYETHFLLQNKQQPTHHFQTFSSSDNKTQVSNSNKRPPEIDLNLKLSLGGIYSENTKEIEIPLTRSSSIAGVITLEKSCSDQFEKSLPRSFLSLARSCSLPAEVERSNKRVVNLKELRTLRRVEAKKRAEEKQRIAKNGSDKEKLLVTEGPLSSLTNIPAWAVGSAAKSPALNRAIDEIKEGLRKLEGLDNSGTPKGPKDSKSSFKPMKAEPGIISETTFTAKSFKLKPDETWYENTTKKIKLTDGYNMQDDGMYVMKKMPSVTTTGDGPNGRKIEGFLYKYMKGQVSIVCVCHGSFLSPEEFVKHAGGNDVTNAMKNINVCTTSFFY